MGRRGWVTQGQQDQRGKCLDTGTMGQGLNLPISSVKDPQDQILPQLQQSSSAHALFTCQ